MMREELQERVEGLVPEEVVDKYRLSTETSNRAEVVRVDGRLQGVRVSTGGEYEVWMTVQDLRTFRRLIDRILSPDPSSSGPEESRSSSTG